MEDPTLYENEKQPREDGTMRKAHYGEGIQPWDITVAQGWGSIAAAFNVIRYMRRTKAPEHSLESARWYYTRCRELADQNMEQYQILGEVVWRKLNEILTDEEKEKLK